MPPRTVALIGAVCVTTGWLLASMLTPPIANLQDLPERRTSAPPQAVDRIDNTAAFGERLHALLRDAPPPPVPRRNPFEFGGRSRVVSVAPLTSVPPPAPPPPAPPAVVGPRFTLSGIAAIESPSGLTHTAVLSDGTTVHLVKVGETVGGYRVVEVTEISVTLSDVSGASYVLRLAR